MARSSGGANRNLPDVCFGSKAEIRPLNHDVCFTPESGHQEVWRRCPLSARSGHAAAGVSIVLSFRQSRGPQPFAIIVQTARIQPHWRFVDCFE
jgi:hypothetical protein